MGAAMGAGCRCPFTHLTAGRAQHGTKQRHRSPGLVTSTPGPFQRLIPSPGLRGCSELRARRGPGLDVPQPLGAACPVPSELPALAQSGQEVALDAQGPSAGDGGMK